MRTQMASEGLCGTFSPRLTGSRRVRGRAWQAMAMVWVGDSRHTSHAVNLVRMTHATRGIPDSGGEQAGDASGTDGDVCPRPGQLSLQPGTTKNSDAATRLIPQPHPGRHQHHQVLVPVADSPDLPPSVPRRGIFPGTSAEKLAAAHCQTGEGRSPREAEVHGRPPTGRAGHVGCALTLPLGRSPRLHGCCVVTGTVAMSMATTRALWGHLGCSVPCGSGGSEG